MRAVLSTCHAVPSLVNALKWTIVFFFLLLQRGSDELFSSCISNGPYIMNSGRGLPWRGESFFIEVLVVSVFVLPWRSIHYSRRSRAFCSLPDCIHFCFFLAANGNDTKKFKGDVRSPGVPSRVVHVRKLPNDINEAEVIGLGLPFGKVTNLLMLKGKNQVRTGTCRPAHQTCMSFTQGWNLSFGLGQGSAFRPSVLTWTFWQWPFCGLVGRMIILHAEVSWRNKLSPSWMSSLSLVFHYLQLWVETC